MRVVTLFLSILNSIIRAFALAYLWRLFVVPLGAPEIGALHAWGLSILLGLCHTDLENIRAICNRDEKDEEVRKMNFVVQFALLIAVPLLTLIVHVVVTLAGPIA